jgi:hypothetical protein
MAQEAAVWLVNFVFPKFLHKYVINDGEYLQIISGASHKRGYTFKMELAQNI